jgi:hypothetical protein
VTDRDEGAEDVGQAMRGGVVGDAQTQPREPFDLV